MARAKVTVRYRLISGFPNYRVGTDGSVWSRWRRSYDGGRRWVIGDTWQRMKPCPRGGFGYLSVGLHRNGKFVTMNVHSLVLAAFVGPRPPGMMARHFPDRDPKNCTLGNLSWATPKTNQGDRRQHGTDIRGERINTAKLDAATVVAIRAEYVPGKIGCRRLGNKYGVSNVAIHKIVTRKHWAHI